MKSIPVFGTLVVVAHLLVNAAHGLAHNKMEIGLSDAQALFVGLVILVAPILAAILLWTRLRRAAGGLLLLSMAGAFLFGLYYHFLYPGPDNVSQATSNNWLPAFRVTAVLSELLELLGCWAGFRALRAATSLN